MCEARSVTRPGHAPRPPSARSRPHRLAAADRASLDAAGLLAAVGARPLHEELPAAALAWRLVPHLAPATVAAAPGADVIRPDWCAALLPGEPGPRVPTDPA
ncbi:hypothetical protein ACI78R_07190 [Geodermatophilus sp. SYSU D01106]